MPSSRPQGVASHRPRPGNDAFFKCIVACMASAPRVDFSSALATAAVVETAWALLLSERPASRQADVLSESGLGSRGLCALWWTRERRPDPCPCQGPADSPRRGPRPCLLAEPRRKSCHNETGVNSDEATVATAGTATVEVAAERVGVATTTHRHGGDSGGGGGRGASDAGVAEGADEGATLVQQPEQWPQLWWRIAREERSTWDGSPTSSRSSSFSSTDDHSEAAVIVGKRC